MLRLTNAKLYSCLGTRRHLLFYRCATRTQATFVDSILMIYVRCFLPSSNAGLLSLKPSLFCLIICIASGRYQRKTAIFQPVGMTSNHALPLKCRQAKDVRYVDNTKGREASGNAVLGASHSWCDQGLTRHIDYIHYNPVKHGHVDRVMDWPYSSFNHYVKRGILPPSWTAAADIKRIEIEWLDRRDAQAFPPLYLSRNSD